MIVSAFQWQRLRQSSYADLASVLAELQQPEFAAIGLVVGGSDQVGQSWLFVQTF